MDNKDEPANPLTKETSDAMLEGHGMFLGLTKREHFAGLAMQGMIREDIERVDCKDDIAVNSVRYADALLKALEGE